MPRMGCGVDEVCVPLFKMRHRRDGECTGRSPLLPWTPKHTLQPIRDRFAQDAMQ